MYRSSSDRWRAYHYLNVIRRVLQATVFSSCLASTAWLGWGTDEAIAETPPLLFVTQMPFSTPFISVNTVFGNHDPTTFSTPRGGDLFIRYSDGSLRNLTMEAGFGVTPGQEIAVREPSVHWSGKKALFSMVIGGSTKDGYTPVYWQIYEISGFLQGQTVQIRKIPQPTQFNNISPLYGTDDRIIFTSDRPRNGNLLTYPQLDEYESVPAVTGIWSMNPNGTDLRLLDHAGSGDFTPILASDGRLIFTRWDHLQRDQLNDGGAGSYGAFTYRSEGSTQRLQSFIESFPEPLTQPVGNYFHGHIFNFFFPWEMNEDGTNLETLNHIGRHELASHFDAAHEGLPEFFPKEGKRTADILLQLKEDPTRPGYFYATKAPEFFTHAAGQIIGLNAPQQLNADDMEVDYITDPLSYEIVEDGQTPPAGHPGHFRNPVPLSNGALIAVRTTSPFADRATTEQASILYDFHLVFLQSGTPYWTLTERLIPGGITKTLSYWDISSDEQVSYSGPLWELDPVEVQARPRPIKRTSPLPNIEAQILNEELKGPAGVEQLRAFLRGRGLALVVSRNVTRRADRQQDVDLKIAGSATQTADPGVTPIEVGFLQFVQADLIRGYDNFIKGRRPIAQPMHDGLNPTLVNAPVGSVQLGPDGSMAAFVPASRALSWQLTTTDGDPVVRERYWLTFAPGEIRVCANCHGVNRTDVVLNQPAPTNPPQALRNLIRWYRATYTTEPPPLSGPAPRITRVSVFRFPFRVMITGQNFRPGVQVFLNADTKPWATTLRNNELLLTLGGEQALMKKLLIGTPTRIRVVTPDGKSASATFTRRS